MSGFDALVCPLCRLPLGVQDRVAGCGSGHRFDLARQGYLNLLGRAAGANADTAEMLDQRQQFLGAGHYQPIVDAVVAACTGASRVLEVGVGTGSYLSAVLDALPEAEGLGLDISPAAARRSTRAHPRLQAVVADAWQPLPLHDEWFDVVLSVFAPRNPAEFARVLGPGGRLVTVTPNSGHLAEARERFGLIDIHPDKDERLQRALEPLFTRVDEQRVAFVLDLDAAAMTALVGMGPNALHEHGSTSPGRVGVDVHVSTWQLN
ncbi:methyltransferase domain-containing protein [Propionibacteriaceae bacterium Y1923]|uniref:methyltransferase domain-containing protein n=1 Tax=Aestuariimicrobium sp. Y1814 TaxID=3418742 RepID=UPI003C1B3566